MTRINSNIQPAHLIDQHLLAEYREIIRIPNVVNTKGYSTNRKYPQTFLLGTGHVLYFYNKIKFLHKRFLALKAEMDVRQMENNIDDGPFLPFINNQLLYNDIPKAELIEGNKLIVDRIIERIETMKRIPTIKGKPVDIEDYKKLLKTFYYQ